VKSYPKYDPALENPVTRKKEKYGWKFKLEALERKLRLAADSEEDRKSWISAIEQVQNDVKLK